MEQVIEWCRTHNMDVQQSELDEAYIPMLDLNISYDGHMYSVYDQVRLYTKQAEISGLIQELNTFL